MTGIGRFAGGVALILLVAHPLAVGQSPTASAAAAGRARPGVLHLRGGAARLAERTNLLDSAEPFASGMRHVIQLDGPMTPRRRAELAGIGVRFGHYLPENAYLADLAGVASTDLNGLGYATWVGPFAADWKVCPNIGGAELVSQERLGLAAAGRLRLSATTFEPADVPSARRALKRIGATIRSIDPDRGRITFDHSVEAVEALRRIPALMFVEEVLEPRPRNITTNWLSQSGIVNQTPLWDAGLHGEAQIAGIIDWYMKPDHCAFDDPVNPIGPLHRKIRAYYGIAGGQGFGDHGTHVAGVCVGDAGGGAGDNLTGLAFASRVVFQNFNSEWNNNVAFLLSRAHADGARIHNNSWGGGLTTYNLWAQEIDLFSRANEDDLVLVATDNSGIVKNPENAKNCLAVAAAADDPDENIRCSGADGPTADGRRKPELLAVGCGSNSADLLDQACVLQGTGCACGTFSGGGTSYAAPAASAMALLARQYFTEGFYPSGAAGPADAFVPSGALLKAALINSAVDMTGVAGYPSNREGWGRLVADNALFFSGDARALYVEDVRNASGLSTGQSQMFNIDVASSALPLRITLVWTDVAAIVGAAFTPVNNLNLRVSSPGGTLYLGNVFAGGQSTTGGSADALNNTEQVHRLSPTAGQWTIQVQGAAVAQSTQGFALVVTGDLATGIDCNTITPADVNQDGSSDGRDVSGFTSLLVAFDGVVDTAAECAADRGTSGNPCTPDATLDLDDIPGFVAYLLDGNCP